MSDKEKRKYEVVTPVEMDKRYEPGKTILLTEEDAKPLLAVGAVKELGAGK